MPELTVSMPAYNTGKYIGEAIESVLRQEGVDFELMVVDDGSEDNTAEVVQSFKDPRIRLIRNEKNMGIAYCHNMVIDESNSPFIAHVDSDDMVLPGAFKKMIDALKSSPRVGQAHCHFIVIDKDGTVIKHAPSEPDMDYKRELLVRGGIINHLRTYRREVFDAVGKFDESLGYSVDCEMALRVVDRHDIKLLPEFLYCRRIHESNTSQSLRLRELKFWYQRVLFTRRLLKSDKIRFVKQEGYSANGLLLLGLYKALRLTAKRITDPVFDNIYRSIVDRVPWRPINLFCSEKRKEPSEGKCVAYYLAHYPALSETFIQREISALRRSGVSVEVIADSPKDLEFLDENAKSLVKNTHYLLPVDANRLLKYRIYFLLKRPLVYAASFLYVITHYHERDKAFTKDKSLFLQAVYLAGVLKDSGVSHIHSPWAYSCAFTSLIASRLLGVPYSVQGRASDIHRKKNLYALTEKFSNAEFVITNTRYNESYINAMLNSRPKVRIYTIYEGIDLDQFDPGVREEKLSNPIWVLSVARLIEEKGLVYLLKACKVLKDRGYIFNCNIIGGVDRQFANHYIELMKLHRQLGLEDRVVFRGAQPFGKVLKEYGNADIFVLPCVVAKGGGRDISPNALIEAMAMKLPAISTNIAAIPEIVEDGVSGILVPPNDENALADAMMRLISDYDLRRELGENARRRVEERFDINKNIVKYVDLFKRKDQLKLARALE